MLGLSWRLYHCVKISQILVMLDETQELRPFRERRVEAERAHELGGGDDDRTKK